ncbi:MAG: energy transducer TonB [Saprospiraceae bacterium]
MTAPESVSHRDALDIVFANRNRAYGAYQLRREYPTALGRAFGFGLLLIGLLVLLPRILAAFAGLVPEKPLTEVIAKTTIINLEKTPPPPTTIAPPPPPPLPKAAIAYTPPVVKPDDEVPVEEPVEVQTLLIDPRPVGSKTVEGINEEPPTLGPASTGLAAVEVPPPPDEKVYDGVGVNKMPSFPGGEAEMFRWIYKHLRYPEMAIESGTSGPVVLTFVVGKDGSIADIAVLKTPAGGSILGKEATRVVQSMPRWVPGEAHGQAVKVRFMLPIRFELK